MSSVGVLSAIPAPIACSFQPVAVAAQAGHHQPGLAHPEGEGEAGELGARVVDEAAVGVADELQAVALVAADQEHDRVDLAVDLRQVDGEHLVVALALAGGVVAEVDHRAVAGGQVVEEREVEERAAGELHGRGVEVDRRRAASPRSRPCGCAPSRRPSAARVRGVPSSVARLSSWPSVSSITSPNLPGRLGTAVQAREHERAANRAPAQRATRFQRPPGRLPQRHPQAEPGPRATPTA